MLDELTPRTEPRTTLCLTLTKLQSCQLKWRPSASPAFACSTCAHLLVAHFKRVHLPSSALPCLACLPQVVTILGAGVEYSILHWTLNRPPHILPQSLPHPSLAWCFVFRIFCIAGQSFQSTHKQSRAPPAPQIHIHSVGYTSIINQYSSIFVRRSLPLDWSAPRV